MNINLHELKTETQDRLKELILGTITREEASAWAMEYVENDNLHIPDRLLWRILKAVGGADARADLDSYLYSKKDFENWLNDLGSE